MKVLCPRCDASIPASQLNVDVDTAICVDCDEAFVLSELLENEVDDDFDLALLPSGVTYDKMIDGFELIASTRSGSAFFLVPFALVWSGATIGGIYGGQIIAGQFDMKASLFGLLFLAGAVVVSWCAILAVCGRLVITKRQNAGSVFIGVGSFGWTRRFDWSAVTRADEERTTKTTSIALDGESRIVFGSMLTAPRRNYVLQALRLAIRSR